MSKDINELLGIDMPSEPIVAEKKTDIVPRKEEKDNDVDNDHDYSREAYYDLIKKGQEAIDGILQVAKEGEHPRAYEVALNGIRQVGDTVDKLQDLNKKLKDLKELPKTADTKIQNALFVGSTAELQKMLKKNENTESTVIDAKQGDIQDK
jgi:hypothetical protein|tara:strand:+ start:437 stop:889 length:453 start_codon:yes stop_codon:yes gene_type:complete